MRELELLAQLAEVRPPTLTMRDLAGRGFGMGDVSRCVEGKMVTATGFSPNSDVEMTEWGATFLAMKGRSGFFETMTQDERLGIMQEVARMIGTHCSASAGVREVNAAHRQGRTPVISWDGEQWSVTIPDSVSDAINHADEAINHLNKAEDIVVASVQQIADDVLMTLVERIEADVQALKGILRAKHA